MKSAPFPTPLIADAASTSAPGSARSVIARRRRGRPTEMTPEAVLGQIRRLARRREGLFRVHRSHGALYSRARRQFGSWADAVRAAGLDYGQVLGAARSRSVGARRKNRTRRAR